ncbi:N-acetylmuramoyl-L-alanine amidase [Mucilaginibacter myungsuensis]|uniref:N-acetylmuramoyl-L-alanine amidase n=1 Tax=Mucilaginibacter myungsuensis TaxID=649104 RepID=A0A929KX53_9SPHI|nr:N-acetylmuramoyl-L-alanine amidase [Mucilaginibacter myungsuensis]MBE9661568.1 N-acetylmuramoyl-L-alanine amidase [Mucilaginibacter myungsuensis]MDN3597711.1 N-acetylmuramoyl-L-alanine amidase [Mucilaginibacter myungsuensis]
MSILLYLLKASACTLAFYAFYRMFLNRLTFFGLNRWYLLGTLALSFIIPALHFSLTREVAADTDLMADEHVAATGAAIGKVINNAATVDTAWSMPDILLYVYLTVAVLLGIKLIAGITKLLVKGYRQGVSEGQLFVVKQAGALHNSSFFNIVFLKNDLDAAEEAVVINHEQEHIKRLHSIDTLLIEIAKVVLWFNPIPYLYKTAMEQVHEYQVDAAVTNRYDRKDYAAMLLKLSGFNARALVNNFSGSQLNKRVNMLFAKGSKQISKVAYLLTAPVVATLVWFICVDHVYAQNVIPVTKSNFTVVIDPGHGGKNTGGQAEGFTEKDLALSIAKAVKTAGDAAGMDIVLTRTTDEYLSFDERLNKKADLFISLHVNSGPYNAKQNGILAITALKTSDASLQLASSCLAELGKLNGIATMQDVKKQRLVVLEKSTVPAALLELGYMTNASDLKFITAPDKQAQMATAIVNGIKQYQAKMK